MKKTNTLALTEAGIMIALSSVLSMLKLIELPYGGSVTFASMLPIVIYSYRHGTAYGVGTALAASVIQLLLGIKNFSYVSGFTSFLVLGLFDYIIAFAVFGLCGSFKKLLPYRTSLVLGTALASVVRYLCHFISGVTIWRDISIPGDAAVIYSLGYNATYMIPETIVLIVSVIYVCSAVDFSKSTPTRTAAISGEGNTPLLKILSAVTVLFALIFDTVMVFSKLQNAETGDFAITNLSEVSWVAVGIVTGISILLSVGLYILAKRSEEKKA